MVGEPRPVSVVTQFAIRGGRFFEMIVGRDEVGDLFIKTDEAVVYLDDEQAKALGTTLLQVTK